MIRLKNYELVTNSTTFQSLEFLLADIIITTNDTRLLITDTIGGQETILLNHNTVGKGVLSRILSGDTEYPYYIFVEDNKFRVSQKGLQLGYRLDIDSVAFLQDAIDIVAE